MLDFISAKFLSCIKKLNYKNIYEIHFRLNRPVIVNYCNEYLYLSSNGTTNNRTNAIYVTKTDIDEIIETSTRHSLFSFEEELSQGYITVQDGVRFGISGVYKYDELNNKVITNVLGIAMRIAHNKDDCSKELLPFILDKNSAYNTLIISPPACGKTTILRDIVYNLSKINLRNFVVIDERNELVNYVNQSYYYDVPDNVDVLTGLNKKDGFDIAIRLLNPSCIITDEIDLQNDIKHIAKAITCGCNVICTCHAKSYEDLLEKELLLNIKFLHLFDRVAIISARKNPGTIEKIINQFGENIYV